MRYVCAHIYIHAYMYLKLYLCYLPAHIHFIWNRERTTRNGSRDSNGCRAVLVKRWFSKHWLKWLHLWNKNTHIFYIYFFPFLSPHFQTTIAVAAFMEGISSKYWLTRVNELPQFLSSPAPPRWSLIPAKALNLNCSLVSWKKRQQTFSASKRVSHFESHWNFLSNFSLVNLQSWHECSAFLCSLPLLYTISCLS